VTGWPEHAHRASQHRQPRRPREQGETEVRRNDLGGWSAICPAHGVVATGGDPEALLVAAAVHDDGGDDWGHR
jgi:hypothetical protein